MVSRKMQAACAAAVGAVLTLCLAKPVGADPVAWKLFSEQKKAADMKASAIGSYTKGCLAGGEMLPISGPGWEAMKLKRNRNWGHPMLIRFLTRFANEVQEKDGWPGLLIGDLAMPRGGPFKSGHRSHQIGLDADIWYKPKPKGEITKKVREDSWSIKLAERYGSKVTKNWKPGYIKVLKRAASYPQTARIFVHPAVKRALCEGAGEDRAWLRKIRPWWLHNYHFHVRLRCPIGVPGCKDQDPPPEGDGCGPQLTDWLKKMEKARKNAAKKPEKPIKPVARRHLRMAQLPESCGAVLKAEDIQTQARTPLPERSAAPEPQRPGRAAAIPQRKPVRPAAPARATATPQRKPAPAAPPATANTDPNLPWLQNITTPLPKKKPQ